jgi:NAD(P)-dependent dehydrogenase (short-subunit alcohol dehydrogenase family)
VASHGPFDILVNSAGLARHSPALDTTEDDFDTVSDVNVKGAYFLTQAVANGLLAAGKPGSLINISSQMAHVGGIDRAVYCATKHAVEGFTKSMAIEWGKAGIRINTICPTFILTDLTRPTFEDPRNVPGSKTRSNLAALAKSRTSWAPSFFWRPKHPQ